MRTVGTEQNQSYRPQWRCVVQPSICRADTVFMPDANTRDLSKRPSKTLSIRMDADLHDWAVWYAKQQGSTVSALVKRCLEDQNEEEREIFLAQPAFVRLLPPSTYSEYQKAR